MKHLFISILLLFTCNLSHSQVVFCKQCPQYDTELFTATYWQTTNGFLNYDDCTIYRVMLYAGESYTFKTGCGNGISADFATRLEIIEGTGCQVETTSFGDCGGNLSRILFSPPTTGYYYVKVRSNEQNGFGQYELAYRMDTSPDCYNCPNHDAVLTPASSWQTHASSLTPTRGCRMYRFNAVSGTQYTFKTGCGDGASSAFYSYLELTDATCNTLAYNTHGCQPMGATLSWTADYSGYAYVRVGQETDDSNNSFTLAYIGTTTPLCTPPPSSFPSASPAIVCEGGSVWLNPQSSCSNCTYTWSPAEWISGNPNTALATALPPQSMTYTVTMSNGCLTVTTASVHVTVAPIPANPSIYQDGSLLICNEAGYAYKWYRGITFTGATSQTYEPTANGYHYVQITDANGCTAYSNEIYLASVGIDEMEEGISIYPNPGKGIFTISMNQTVFTDATLRIVNHLAQEVYTTALTGINNDYKKELDLGHLAAGIYSVQVSNSEKTVVKTIVLESRY